MKTVTVITLCVMLVAALFVVGCGGGTAEPEDIPAPEQAIFDHSSLTTSDGSIKDNVLVLYICNQIPKDENGVPQVKDVKIMFNSCYGGGFADNFEKIFASPYGKCKGVPWIFGSASQPNETAWGPNNAYAGQVYGSFWTNALVDAIKDTTSDNVQEDFEAARDNDLMGPKCLQKENPVIASGNGGGNIVWNAPGTNHSAVVFGGMQTNNRHHNNVNNVEEALEIVWSGSSYNIEKIDGGTTAELLSAIDAACSRLDSDTELVLYFDDHGDTHSVLDELLEWGPEPCYIYTLLSVTFPLHPGWEQGLSHTDDPAPFITLGLVEPILGEEWAISLNDVPIALPAGNLTGECELAVNWTSIHAGNNTLEISPLGEPSGPMVLDNLELCSGPINEATGCILTISSTDGGSVTTPGEGTSAYYCGTVVNLVAAAEDGYSFVAWTGDVDTIGDVYDPSTTITMNENYSITATFQLAP